MQGRHRIAAHVAVAPIWNTVIVNDVLGLRLGQIREETLLEVLWWKKNAVVEDKKRHLRQKQPAGLVQYSM